MKGMPHFRQYPMGDTVPGYIIDQDDPQQKVQREIAVSPGEYIVRRESVNAAGVDNMERINHFDGAQGQMNQLMVMADLQNKLVQDNAPEKSDVNGFPVANSPVRQRVDATRQMQGGGSVRGYQEGDLVEEGRSVQDYLGSLQENYQKYQGDVMTEAGDLRFNPSGQFTREGLAEEYNFPLEEAKFDTLYGYGTPGATSAAIDITLPDGKISHQVRGPSTEKWGEGDEIDRTIRDRMMKEHQGSYIDLNSMMGGDYSEAIEAEEAGYLDMGPFEQMEYGSGKAEKVFEVSRKKKEEDRKSLETSPEYRKKMMEGLGIKSDEEYDAFLEFKRSIGGGYQQGGPVYGYKNGGQVKRDKPSGNWGGEQGSYMKALEATRDSTMSEQELKSMALMDHFRKMGTGERMESSDMYNGEPAYKSEEAYKRAFGMQTPLNAKERFTQIRLGLNPETFSAQQRGLLGKALLQRLGNEVQ